MQVKKQNHARHPHFTSRRDCTRTESYDALIESSPIISSTQLGMSDRSTRKIATAWMPTPMHLRRQSNFSTLSAGRESSENHAPKVRYM